MLSMRNLQHFYNVCFGIFVIFYCKLAEKIPGETTSVSVIDVTDEDGYKSYTDQSDELLQYVPKSRETYVHINPELTQQQKNEVNQILREYNEMFVKVPVHGITTLAEHKIETTKEPVRKKPYPVPYAVRPFARIKAEQISRYGIIEKSTSSYCW